MDPQQRVFLECAAEALEHAGYGPGSPAADACRIGVYAGAGMSEYGVHQLFGNPAAAGGMEVMLGNDKDFLATRAAYKLDLRGPALAVQTACSTSLVAVHLACRALLEGECDIALAGGVGIGFPERAGYLYEEGGVNSADGHNRSFDARATGTVGSSGVGIVVLKPLAAALAAGDPIRAVIRATAINNDGAAKVGYTAPGETGQAAAIARAQELAGIAPESVQYVEAHGSATPIGDPIEVAALTRAFRARMGREGKSLSGFCALGSVKSNIGHTGSAAGIAGLIKTVLALEHREIPPSLHFEIPNPRLPLAGSPFRVAAALEPWPAGEGEPRRAGVSSFGLGGTNAHAVLEEAPEPPPAGPARPWHLLALSARTATALEAATDRLADHLAIAPGGGSRRRRLHPPHRPPGDGAPPHPRLPRPRGRPGRPGEPRPPAGAGEHRGGGGRRRPAGGLRLRRARRAVPGDGARPLPRRAGLPGGFRPRRRSPRAARRDRPRGSPLPGRGGGEGRRRRDRRHGSAADAQPPPLGDAGDAGADGRRPARPHGPPAAGVLRSRLCSREPPPRLGGEAAGDDRLQPGRVRGRLSRWGPLARRRRPTGGAPGAARRRPPRGGDARRAALRSGACRPRCRRGSRSPRSTARGRRSPRGLPAALAELERQLSAAGIAARRLRTTHAFHSPMLSPAAPAPGGSGAGDRSPPAAHPLRLERHRHLDHGGRGDRSALLGGAPAAAGALRPGDRRALARARPGAPGDRPRPEPLRPRPPVGGRRSYRPRGPPRRSPAPSSAGRTGWCCSKASASSGSPGCRSTGRGSTPASAAAG